MSEKQIMIMASPAHKARAMQMVDKAPLGMVVTVEPQTRSKQQNAMLWACLTDVSRQVEYYGKRYDCNGWKNIFTGSLMGMEAVPAIDGKGVVMIGQSTSVMNKSVFADLLTLIQAFGAEHGVAWSDDADAVFRQWLKAA